MQLAWAPLLLGASLSAGQVPARFTHGAVVSDSQIASEVGAAILRKGGNAVDAAVAVGFALAVTFPAAGNVGGGGFMVVRMADGRTVAIDYRERAPLAARADMYAAKPSDSLDGPRAAGVPGTVAGLVGAHARFGKLKWKEVVEPSVRLAKDGFELEPGLAEDLRRQAARFKRFPASYKQFSRAGRLYAAGEVFRQPELASTLARVRDHGVSGFYEGETARLIAASGAISLRDLSTYRVSLREPLRGNYKNDTILTMPPPSSGGVALLQMLQMLRKDDLRALGFQSSGYLHLLAETMRRAFADRSAHLADPDFVSVPVGRLLALDYTDRLRGSIGERATPSSDVEAMPEREFEETTHFSVVDRSGNAVSNTYTLNGSYGSGYVVPGAGFLLNNEMDDFTTQPGKPNMFGLIQSAKNQIEPGKRPLSSMTPTIVVRDGKPFLVLGSPGGPTIINTVLQTYLNIVEFQMNPQRAVSAPRYHHQWLPDMLNWEPYAMPSDLRAALEARGHKLAPSGRTMGSCHVIMIDPVTGERQTGADPRTSTSGAAGY